MARRRRDPRDPTEMEKLGELEALKRLRDSYPLPGRVEGLFQSSGSLKSEYVEHRPAQRALTRYHKAQHGRVKGYRVSPGIAQALKLPLLHGQIVHRYPWAIYWITRKGSARKRYKKLYTSLGAAIIAHSEIVQLVPNATIISRARGYHIPPELRGKLPVGWSWCPHCMKPRRYKRDPSEATFWAMKQYWNDEKQKWDEKERKLALIRCPMCGTTNRDSVYRASNQPWKIRKFKRGVRRAKRGIPPKPLNKRRRRR